jgi:carbamoyl-phosphate synthase/aspartate carbamoyltransferase
MSKGYRSRRLAVDFAVPLITNVKCAKLFVEAISRRPTFQISSVDFQTSHETLDLPGFVALQAFAPGLSMPGSKDVAEATAAALRGGFTMVQFAPQGLNAPVADEATLDAARSNGQTAHCSYSLGVAATTDNAPVLAAGSVALTTGALFLPTSLGLAAVVAHFTSWPADKPIVTDAKRTDLASILLLANLHNRGIHVSNVTTQEDIQLIALSKAKGLRVTCDVSVYALMLASEEYPGATSCLPSASDRKALWANMASIDAFSIGNAPYELARDLKQAYSPRSGYEEALPLLLSALADGRLTLEDIVSRLSDNPRMIFGLPPASADDHVEVELNTRSMLAPQSYWSPLDNKPVAGAVHRVAIGGRTVVLDGRSSSDASLSLDVSATVVPKARRRTMRFSASGAVRPTLAALGAGPAVSSSSIDVLARSPTSAAHLVRSPPPAASTSLGRDFSPALAGVDGSLKPSLMGLSAPLVSPPSVLSNPAFSRRHILSIKQFTRVDLHALFNLANELRVAVERNQAIDILRGRVLCTLFYEPSTRTSASFEAAMCRLGGKVVAISADRSSVTKGESLADSVRMLAGYGDAIVLRHPIVGSVGQAAKVSTVPVINAGDGIGEHPTQVRARSAFETGR